jgi:hypothetical protein
MRARLLSITGCFSSDTDLVAVASRVIGDRFEGVAHHLFSRCDANAWKISTRSTSALFLCELDQFESTDNASHDPHENSCPRHVAPADPCGGRMQCDI